MDNGLSLSLVHSAMNSANAHSVMTPPVTTPETSTDTAIKRKRRKISADDASSLSCVVCGSQAFGYNFDVISCESCKAFFRRNADKGVTRLSRCQKDGCCPITSFSRKHCPACRMKKCLASGMRKELITPMEKLKNRANYRGKRHERKAMKAKVTDEDSARSTNSDDSKDDVMIRNQMVHSNDSHEAREESKPNKTSTPSPPVLSLALPPAENSLSGSDTQGPSPTTSNNAEPQIKPEPMADNNLIPMEKLAGLPPDIMEKVKNMPPEIIAKFRQSFMNAGRAAPTISTPSPQTSIDEHAMARECTRMWSGQEPPAIKAESPPADPASFMGAMQSRAGSISSTGGSSQQTPPPRDPKMGMINHAALFLEGIKLMPVIAAPPGHVPALREDTFVEYFNNIKAGFINIAKPLKKSEIVRTQLAEMPNCLESSFNHMENMVRRVIAVLKCLPQFVVLTRDIQIALLKRSIHGLFAFCGAMAYDTSQNAIRVVYEEDNGDIKSFYLDFSLYVTQGLKDIQTTDWESKEVLGYDKVNELICVNQIVFSRITNFTKGDHLLLMGLLCLRFFRESTDSLKDEGIAVNEGMQWLMARTRSEMDLYIREYVARKWPSENVEKNYTDIMSLFESIRQLERAGELLSRVVRVDNLNPLMKEFLLLPRPPSNPSANGVQQGCTSSEPGPTYPR